MQLFVTISHIMLCIVLILIILLQPGKDSAAIFGGGQGGNKMYGVRSNANPLSRATTTIAVLFMVTSITLAWYSSASAQDDSGLKDAINKQLNIVNAKDITFEVQKVYGISPFQLVKDPKSALGGPNLDPSNKKGALNTIQANPLENLKLPSNASTNEGKTSLEKSKGKEVNKENSKALIVPQQNSIPVTKNEKTSKVDEKSSKEIILKGSDKESPKKAK